MEEKCLKLIQRSISLEVQNWQAAVLNTHFQTEKFDCFKEDFKLERLDLDKLIRELNKIWLEELKNDIFAEKVGLGGFLRYGLEMSAGLEEQVMDEIKIRFDFDLINEVERYMRIIQSAKDLENGGGSLLFKELGNLSLLLKSKSEQSSTGPENEPNQSIQNQEELDEQKKESLKKYQKNAGKLKMADQEIDQLATIDSIPITTKVLLYSCLSKCTVWPRLMSSSLAPAKKSKKKKKGDKGSPEKVSKKAKNQKKNKKKGANKSNNLVFLANWFKSFHKIHKRFIKSYRDLWMMDSKDVRTLRKIIWESKDWDKDKCIFNLAWEGKTSEVKKILLQGKDVNMRNGKKAHWGLLHIAVYKQNYELFDLLIKCGADVNIRNRLLMTPIFYAVEMKDHYLIRKLHELGAELNIQEKNGSSLFYWAIFSSDLQTLKVISSLGASKEIVNTIKRSPLIKACFLKKLDIVKWLLQFPEFLEGLDYKDHKGRTAVHSSCWGPRGGKEGKKADTLTDCPEGLKLLLDAGADPLVKDIDGFTALNCCISTAGIDSARVLLSRGFDFKEGLDDGRNNVFIASEYGSHEMLPFLKDEVGMDLYSVKEDGVNTLDWAFLNGRFETWVYLVEDFAASGLIESKPEILKNAIEMLIKASKSRHSSFSF